jgi:hypothetical protein
MMRTRAALALATVVALAHAGALFGQGFQGGVRGAIKDAGGVLPGVEVTLTNEKTNITRSTTTNERGEYVFSNVDPGSYAVKAVLAGYKTIDRREIPIGTQQFLTLDLLMEVGAIEENITVTGQSPLIETSNASQGTVLDSTALQTLPSPGRAAFLIGTTVPTVIPTGDTQFNRQQDQTNASLLSLGGGTRRGNNYTLDGVPITDLRNRAVANPSIEALEDMKVQVHTYDAEMGRTGGGVFNTTLKSGTNRYQGTAFFQVRPIWGQTNNFFSEKEGRPKPDSPYYLGGGAFGGPIKRNRTFFWFSSEDYHDVQTRNIGVVLPTTAERNGDFSGLRRGGQPVTIYDPLTRLPFPNDVIPANRINPVAAAMLQYLPTPDRNVDDGDANYNRTSLINNDFEQMYSAKVEHKFTDNVSLSGFYLYNRTDEPCANYFGTADQTEPNRFADPNDYILKRRPQIVALNNTWVLSDNSVMALRYGWTTFPDDNTLSADFSPSSLPFSQTYLSQITLEKFPRIRIREYDGQTQTMGAINPTEINWKSWGANGVYSKFIGTHTFKVGADFRRIGLDTFIPGDGAGYFDFDRDITSVNGTNGAVGTVGGNAFASFLLGLPSSLDSRQSYLTSTTPLNIFANYYGGYVQDDWRVSSNVTLNYGLRIEHEDGMREVNNNFTVGFDPAATLNGITNVATIAADPVAGTAARPVTGGLMYAGLNGAPETHGNPPKVKWSPRIGAVYSLNTKTVVRGGYGIYWAPYNYPIPSTTLNNYGQVGFTQNTISPQPAFPAIPTVTLTNPFPLGIVPPLGNSLGARTGVGTAISYVDQNSRAPRVQQYSVDFQRELPANMAILLSYVGARGAHLGLGGSNDAAVNINQLDPKYMALGSAALNAAVPNPFLGNPAFAGTAFFSQATLQRRQLLRPYPQFQDILARHVTEGKNLYNAAVIEWSKRLSHGIGGRVSYTYSVLKDNQFAESNFYVAAPQTNPLNSFNYIPGSPYYNPDADWAYGVLDVPHRIIIAPVFELPFGTNRRWVNNGGPADWILGGWIVSAAMNFQSGFPLTPITNDNTNAFVGFNRPNLTDTAIPTSGGYEDRLASADHRSATWVNPAAFAVPPASTFGTAPRTITDARSATQRNVDASFIKNFRLGGSKAAQLKIETLNLFNRVNVRTLQGANNVSNSNFGQTNTQAGFMRITQIMFRFSF